MSAQAAKEKKPLRLAAGRAVSGAPSKPSHLPPGVQPEVSEPRSGCRQASARDCARWRRRRGTIALGSGSGLRCGPSDPRCSCPAPADTSLGHGPNFFRPRYSPPTRYMLAAMAVPAAASGHTKRSGRLAGAKLGSTRSPQRGADASRKCRWGPRSRHLCSLSRRGSSLPARRRRFYSLTPGHRGRRRPAWLLPETSSVPA